MHCKIFTTLFFAIFALFSMMAHAAPVAPQGALLNRQCGMPECRDATGTPSTPSSADRFAMISNIITNLLSLMGSNGSPSGNTSTSTTVTAATTTAAPPSDPTGA